MLHKNSDLSDPMDKDFDYAKEFKSLDLNAGVPGGLFQDVPTQPGRGYAVSFALAGNPCTDPPFVKTLTVTFGGVTQSFQFDTTGTSRTQMGWTATTLGTGLPAACSAGSADADGSDGPVGAWRRGR